MQEIRPLFEILHVFPIKCSDCKYIFVRGPEWRSDRRTDRKENALDLLQILVYVLAVVGEELPRKTNKAAQLIQRAKGFKMNIGFGKSHSIV